MKNILLPIITLVVLLLSCTKQSVKQSALYEPVGNMCVNGQVKDKTTGVGVPNVSIIIFGIPPQVCCTPVGGIGDPGGVQELIPQDSTITDANGNYNICFDSSAHYFYCASTKGNNFFLNDSTDNIFFSGPTTNGLNFILSPQRIVQLHIQIVNSARNSFYSTYTTMKTNVFHGAFLILKPGNIMSFDTTINLKALALGQFAFSTEGCSFYSGAYSNCYLPINDKFFVENVDTTRISYIIN